MQGKKEETQEEKEVKNKEDLIMKRAAAGFGNAFLKTITGQEGEVAEFAQTEQVFLSARDGSMDFLYLMQDGTYVHLEFQSHNKGKSDLIRFNMYDLMLMEQTGKDVKTYVIFSGDIKNPVTEYQYAENTYRVTAICMAEENADEVFTKIDQKLSMGEPLIDEDLLNIVFTPIMGGTLPKEDRIIKGIKAVKNSNDPRASEIQAMLYLFASKFLDNEGKENIKEIITMTELGEMIMEEGFKRGEKSGLERGMKCGLEQGKINGVIEILSKSQYDPNAIFESQVQYVL